MSKKITLMLVSVLMGFCLSGRAQNESEATSEVRKIISGDQVRILVQEQPDLEGVYAVAGDGSVDFEAFGRVEIEDLTTDQAGMAIKEYLEARYFKRATVSVSIADFVQGEVRITGAVNNGAVLPFTGDRIISLFDAIMRAGGLAPNANASAIKILRWEPGAGLSRRIITIDALDMFTKYDFSNDEYLRPRDLVIVPTNRGEDAKEILYIGHVGAVGYHAWYDGLNVLRHVANTGGVGQGAQMDAARILRPTATGDYTPIAVNLQLLLSQGDMSQNHDLMPGDILYVPGVAYSNAGQAWILGHVGRQGPIDLPVNGEMGVARAVMAAGVLETSKVSNVLLKRKDPNGEERRIRHDVKAILATGDWEKDIPLQDGDTIIVDEIKISIGGLDF